MAHTIRRVETLNEKSKTHTVVKDVNDNYQVTSGTSGATYEVNVWLGSCSCPRQEWIGEERNQNRNACSHYMAAYKVAQREVGYQAIPRPADMNVKHLRRMVTPYGDGVQFTSRRVTPVAAPRMSVDAINDLLFG